MNPDNTNQRETQAGEVKSDEPSDSSSIIINRKVTEKNDYWAGKNRLFFREHKLLSLNLLSSPGSGKTTLLQRLAEKLKDRLAVIAGDLQTDRDARRISSAGSRAFQIETGGSCHLEAQSIWNALSHLDLTNVEYLVIENVGNLVCPAAYDLGEHLKAAILSLPEGDDKVLKYPSLFSKISTLIINKIDLAPVLDFDVNKAVDECRSLSPEVQVFNISAKGGEGLDDFLKSLKCQRDGLPGV